VKIDTWFAHLLSIHFSIVHIRWVRLTLDPDIPIDIILVLVFQLFLLCFLLGWQVLFWTYIRQRWLADRRLPIWKRLRPAFRLFDDELSWLSRLYFTACRPITVRIVLVKSVFADVHRGSENGLIFLIAFQVLFDWLTQFVQVYSTTNLDVGGWGRS